MAQIVVPVTLPIALQCLRIPAIWQLRTVKGTRWFVPADISDETATSYDPWEMRDEFQRLKEGDDAAAITFLNTVGLWNKADIVGALDLAKGADSEQLKDNFRYFEGADGAHLIHGAILPTLAEHFWQFRRLMIRQMKDKAGGFNEGEYVVRFSKLPRMGPTSVITTVAFVDAIAASIQIDHLKKLKLRKCRRPDCPVTFTTSDLRKIYCDQPCAHLESMRRKRKAERKTRRK